MADSDIVGGVLGLVDTGINAAVTAGQNKKQRKWAQEQNWKAREANMAQLDKQNQYNREQWERQRSYNEEVWAKENAYNTPSAQMQRFKEAGLNPNLIYGQSNMGGSIDAAQIPQSGNGAPAHPTEFEPKKMPEFDLQGGLFAYNNFQQQAAQRAVTEKQLEVMDADILYKKMAAMGVFTKSQLNEFELGFRQDTRPSSVDWLKKRNDNLDANTNKTISDMNVNVARANQWIQESITNIARNIATTEYTKGQTGLLGKKGLILDDQHTLLGLQANTERTKPYGNYLDNLLKMDKSQLNEVLLELSKNAFSDRDKAKMQLILKLLGIAGSMATKAIPSGG